MSGIGLACLIRLVPTLLTVPMYKHADMSNGITVPTKVFTDQERTWDCYLDCHFDHHTGVCLHQMNRRKIKM